MISNIIYIYIYRFYNNYIIIKIKYSIYSINLKKYVLCFSEKYIIFINFLKVTKNDII